MRIRRRTQRAQTSLAETDHYFVPFTTLDSSIKCHCNPFIPSWVILLTDKQTNATENITSFVQEVQVEKEACCGVIAYKYSLTLCREQYITANAWKSLQTEAINLRGTQHQNGVTTLQRYQVYSERILGQSERISFMRQVLLFHLSPYLELHSGKTPLSTRCPPCYPPLKCPFSRS